MSFEIKGFDELSKSLKSLEKKVKSLDGSEIPFDDLFNKNFLNKYTSVSTFDEFLIQGNFIVDSKEDFEAIPDKEFDEYVAKVTKFKNWDAMFSKATDTYLDKLLQF
ncbi:MAG: hypothetical protein WBI07_13415 [Mobilitalea sp.]